MWRPSSQTEHLCPGSASVLKVLSGNGCLQTGDSLLFQQPASFLKSLFSPLRLSENLNEPFPPTSEIPHQL